MASPERPRWFQYRLATLLAAVTLVAVGLYVYQRLYPAAYPEVNLAQEATALASYTYTKKIVVAISEDDLKRSPPWRIDQGDPPLAARRAMALAEGVKRKLVKDDKDWTWNLASAQLVPAGGQRWYWLMRYEAAPTSGSFSGQLPYLRLVVLMDGTVVKPQVADRP